MLTKNEVGTADMLSRLHIGTSGWVYSDWKGVFYPEDLKNDDRLAYYAARFDTVEINSTHYRLASEPAVRRWQSVLPSGFRMVAKGSAFITHRLKLKNCEQALARFFLPLGPLTSLDVVLWQFPAKMPRDLERVETFLGLLPRHVKHAMEFRDPWWWSDDVRQLLARHDVAFCAVSHPELPSDIVTTGDLVYVRFHGLGEALYHYHYSREELLFWKRQIARVREGRVVYAFFNNDYEAHAIDNARTLRDMLAGKRKKGDVHPEPGPYFDRQRSGSRL